MKYKAAILVTSDRASKGIYEDESGQVLKNGLEKMGFEIVYVDVIADDYEKIKDKLKFYVDKGISLVLTSGGTGFSKRDVTPEASIEIIERPTPGISEYLRYESANFTKRAYLSRAVSGIAKDSLIINMPGSPKACKENLELLKDILMHGLDTIKGIDKH